MVRRMLGWLVLALGLAASAPLPAQEVPPLLRDWQGWVLHEVPRHACPLSATPAAGDGGRTCAWPGRLSLEAAGDGAGFRLEVRMDATDWVPLPGSDRVWPQQVEVDERPVPVLHHDGGPAVRLPPGDHHVRGRLPWSVRPPRLRVPASIGLIDLRLDGTLVAHQERHGDQLTLGEAATAQRSADAVALRVHRRLQDGLPPRLRTRLQLDVTGSARELVLGPVLPSGFVATALDGALPARLEADGRLRVQVRPGHWLLTLDARGTQPLAAVRLELPPQPWPRQEVWSYADDTDLRSTRVKGQGTDAAQAGVPGGWSELPAYVLDDGHGLEIEQVTRGGVAGDADRLALRRRLWLDFDGRGFSVDDRLTGTLRHRQRLNVTAPWQLQRAALDDRPLLVTRDAGGRRGVELRAHELDLQAGLRLADAGGRMPASGWQVPLERIDATLQLPPGYRLLGAVGVDRSPDSWVARWSLLDVFVVALIALLAGRLLGWRWALPAAGFLILAQHEFGAPRWTLALALGAALLMRALPAGRLRRGAGLGAGAALALALLWSLPFASTQLQYALYPQLDAGSGRTVAERFVAPQRVLADLASEPQRQPSPKIVKQVEPPPVQERSAMATGAMPAPPAPPAPPTSLSAVQVDSVSSASGAGLAMQFDRRSVIQAGAGIPHWGFGDRYRLGWSGPVSPSQTARLVIAPAWAVRGLRVLMVALLALVLARLASCLWRSHGSRQSGGRAGRGAAVAGAVLFAVLLSPGMVRAQAVPSAQLLQQLRGRLTEAPACAPDCAVVPRATLQAGTDRLELILETHAGATVAVPLPRAGEGLRLLDATVDGRGDVPLSRHDGRLLVRVERGVHVVRLRFRIESTDSIELEFPLRPQRLTWNGGGWSIEGIEQGRLLGDSLTLTRIRGDDGAAGALPAQRFPPYVQVRRRLLLGVDWQVQNSVRRIAPENDGFSVSIPLLHGEHPLVGDALPVQDGRIRVTFRAGQDLVTWNSRLDPGGPLQLQAPELGRRAEVWEVQAAPMWHVRADGVPGSVDGPGRRYRPLPGEKLKLTVTRPAAADGASLAFDSVLVRSDVGLRATETVLSLRARSTRGGEHAVGLPAGAELLESARDGSPVPVAVRDGKAILPLLSGEHAYMLRLRTPQAGGARLRTPAFALAAPAANIDLELRPPQDRWVIWTWGPTIGPAVLYWPQLAVLLVAAWLLGRYAPTPLRFRHWLLLGVGFSAFAWSAFALVVLWLVLSGLRARRLPVERLGRWSFNLLQLGLAVLTVSALAVLVAAVPQGLLGQPDMHIAGYASSADLLRWFADRAADLLPQGGMFSLPLWAYKAVMLAWALWLANALIGWLKWVYQAWTRDGYWRRRVVSEGSGQ